MEVGLRYRDAKVHASRGGDMKHTPWTQEQAEKWAKEETFEFHGCFTGDCPHTNVSECGQHFFLAGLAKAAEMIEASPTVYGDEIVNGCCLLYTSRCV